MSQPSMMPAEDTAKARQHDGVIQVIQDNSRKVLSIHAMNTQAEAQFGYAKGELLGRKFEVLLAPKLNELLSEEIEFESESPDLGEVIGKQRQLRMRHRNGEELSLNFTLSRVGVDASGAVFQFVLPNEREMLARQKIREFIATNLEGRKQLDPLLGLPDRATASEFLPLICTYLSESNLPVTFAVLRMDRHQKSVARYGKEPCVELLKHVVDCCRATFRSEDMIFVLSDNLLGLLMVDLSRESARVVFNRLRWNIRNHRLNFGGKADFSVTTSVAFDMLNQTNSTSLLQACEDAMTAVEEDSRNCLIELTT